jgi:hypothetical protein
MIDEPPKSTVADLTGASGQQESTQKLLDQIPQLIPGVPNSAWVPIMWGQLRGVVAALSGLGFGWARYIEGSEFQQYLTGAFFVGMLVLSGWSKVNAEIAKYRAAAVSADASANATANSTPATVAPVSVAVTPAGTKVI